MKVYVSGSNIIMKRTGKFYYKNEKQVMKFLGLEPVPGSGSGWIFKEDGESETVMVQLKSTDSNNYKLQMLDMKKLEYHASVSNKVPIFLVQFLQQDKIYAIVEVGNIGELCDAFQGVNPAKSVKLPKETSNIESNPRKRITSSKKSIQSFYKEREESYVGRKNRNSNGLLRRK